MKWITYVVKHICSDVKQNSIGIFIGKMKAEAFTTRLYTCTTIRKHTLAFLGISTFVPLALNLSR